MERNSQEQNISTLTLILSYSYSHTHTLTLILSHSYSHTHTLTLILSHSYSHTHTLTLILSHSYSHHITNARIQSPRKRSYNYATSPTNYQKSRLLPYLTPLGQLPRIGSLPSAEQGMLALSWTQRGSSTLNGAWELLVSIMC